ncbi:phospholipase D, partial [Amanita rubescens]
VTPPTSPAARTGPPRSLSFSLSPPGSPSLPKQLRRYDTIQGHYDDGDTSFSPDRMRGVLECIATTSPSRDKKGKRRETTVFDDNMHVLHESPGEEKTGFDFNAGQHTEAKTDEELATSPSHTENAKQRSSTQHTSSGWARLRSLLPRIVDKEPTSKVPDQEPDHPHASVNIADELIGGGLCALIPGLWFQRDEKGRRRIPILLHRLCIRISDSLNPLHIRKAVFRIECEYANGAARWVIYRELRDFLRLHIHYKFTRANAHHGTAKLPEFPKSNILYWKLTKKEDTPVSHAEFARNQRESLEEYLICLLRAVMFFPSANHLANFLELSTLFISLAQTGGIQAKASFLKIHPIASGGGGFGRKSVSRWDRGESLWCAIRDSYMVVVDEPGKNAIWDVFLLDPHFEIQRPKRYYRQGLNLFHQDFYRTSSHVIGTPCQQKKSLFQSLRLQLSTFFSHSRGPSNQSDPFQEVLGTSPTLAEIPSTLPTPMLDPSTHVNPLLKKAADSVGDDRNDKNKDKGSAADFSRHTFYIINSQMELKLRARSERQMLQWITALQKVSSQCQYTKHHRYDSFAPVRSNVAAQWLVDGRDYFWNLSRAILLAKESIYIHDWWLSPELQLRRPQKERYRLDNLLQRKAREGVKIYVILYQEVSNRTTPTDSNYAKQTLTSLHSNIMVQRSPSHLQTGTLYWAHHEKLCVIDQTIAFMGGIDLCFGRWDSPQHVLMDDGQESDRIWQGKDYSNPRLRDFYELHKPFEEMYDRSKTPRMPWHDVGLQIVGQPARDLARHFIQRWNWLLRIKNHSRRFPCLLPPPEFRETELAQMGLTGTCELQICRSVGPWSLGTLGHVEQSIQNAYVQAIQNSEHFVYIENQFFITSTIINETKVENKIGDALFNRIMRAYKDDQPWKCCIVIPLLPGFTFPVDHADASALRIILDCQTRSLCRGEHSIFSRLRKERIDPDKFISILSLRNWGKRRDNTLMTEQVYIHAKVCIVDDRLAIIGSANINERSQRGERDSELAAIIKDTDLVDGMMAGKRFKVGRFAHSLRLRLMREHLGMDVDALSEDVSTSSEPSTIQKPRNPNVEQENVMRGNATRFGGSNSDSRPASTINEVRDGSDQEESSTQRSKLLRLLRPKRSTPTHRRKKSASEERKDFSEKRAEVISLADSPLSSPDKEIASYKDGKSSGSLKGNSINDASVEGNTGNAAHVNGILVEEHLGASRSDYTVEGSTLRARSPIRGGLYKSRSKIWAVPTSRPQVDPDIFEDPLADAFWKDVWLASAEHNTRIYRKVFHAVPDDTVATWKQYKDFILHHARMNRTVKDGFSSGRTSRASVVDIFSNESSATRHEPVSAEKNGSAKNGEFLDLPQGSPTQATVPLAPIADQKPRKPMKGLEPFSEADFAEMEALLDELNGHLVVYPSKFLEGEVGSDNLLFPADRMLPLPIYN